MDISAVTRTVGRSVLTVKKNSPTLMFVVGLASVTTAAVMASRATLRLEEVLNEDLTKLEDINAYEPDDVKYTVQDQIQDKTIVMTRVAVEVVKLYGPSVAVGLFGIACLTGSHNILMKRNAALTAAYVALERSYNAYRKHVAEAFGEEKEREVHWLVQKGEVDKDKNLEVSKKGRIEGASMYSTTFDNRSSNWGPSFESNFYFVSCQETLANQRLHGRGYLLLNEIYESLGLPSTTAGCVTGWVMGKENGGDQWVDFGISDPHTREPLPYLRAAGPDILLDFNVDGVVYDLLDKLER